MNIVLTGGSGFLGSALTRHLQKAGHTIGLLLRPSSRLDRLRGIEAKLDICRSSSGAEIAPFLQKFQPDVVIHTACAYGRQDESILQLSDTNVRYGLMIMQSLIGLKESVTFINTGTVLEPDVNPYALSKHQLADWGRFMAQQSSGQLRFVNVLLQHMYGPGDDVSKFTTHVLRACYRNDPELKLTAGEQQRDFVFIDDVVNAYSVLAEQRDQLAIASDIQVGSGIAPTVREFVELVHRLTGSSTRLSFGAMPYRSNEAMHCQADISHMKTLGWQPKFDLESGLKKTLELEFIK